MSCSVTPDMDADVKIDILLANAAWNKYLFDKYGMESCKRGYEYPYLEDLKFLLKMTACGEETCTCYCNCSNKAVKERINRL